MTCKQKWLAPYLLPPPSKKVEYVEQVCCLEPGHVGVHRSRGNVISR